MPLRDATLASADAVEVTAGTSVGVGIDLGPDRSRRECGLQGEAHGLRLRCPCRARQASPRRPPWRRRRRSWRRPGRCTAAGPRREGRRSPPSASMRTAAVAGSANHVVGFHMGCSLKARSASARASTVAPSSAPVTSASSPAPARTIVVSASRFWIASAAAPGVRPPTGTPATDVPGAISTSDEATRPTTATPAAMPIHRAVRALAAARAAAAHAYAARFAVAVDGGWRHPAGGRGRVVERRVIGTGPGGQIGHAYTPRLRTRHSMVRDDRWRPGNGCITDAACSCDESLRARRSPGMPRWSPGMSCPAPRGHRPGKRRRRRRLPLPRPPRRTSPAARERWRRPRRW